MSNLNLRRVTYFPPDGSPLVIGRDGYPMIRWDGSLSTRTSLLTRKAPGQVGATGVDRQVDDRRVAAQILVHEPDALAARREIASHFAGVPTVGMYKPGLLMFEDGDLLVQTEAEPHDSPRIVATHHRGATILDLEFHCPSPLWWETSDRVVRLDPEPLSHLWEAEGFLGWEAEGVVGWEAGALSASANIVNGGDVPVPFIVRFYGPQTTARLRITTGGNLSDFYLDAYDDYEVGPDGEIILTLEVQGPILSGSYVEVDTGVRGRSVELVTGDDRETALDRLNPDLSPLRAMQIPKGASTLTWDANEIFEGSRAVVLYREARAGV